MAENASVEFTFVHPRNAYRLRYPAHWEHLVNDDGGSCGFGPRDRDDVGLWITILPISIDSERIEELLPELFTQTIGGAHRNVRHDPALQHFGLKAEIGENREGGHFWILTGGDLVLFASSQVPTGERDIWNPQFDRVMASLEVTRRQELLLCRTADEVLKRLRSLQPEQDFRFDGERIQGRDRQISLANLYKRVTASPERQSLLTEAFIQGLASVVEGSLGHETLRQVRNNILPILRTSSYLKTSGTDAGLLATDWLDDLAICYTIRTEKIMRLINSADLERWNITANSLHRMAIDNLVRLAWPERLQGARQMDGRLILVANDHLGSSRLLNPELHGVFSKQLGSPFYAGVPSSDTLVVFSGANPSFCHQVLRKIKQDHEASAYPITPRAFRVDAQGVTLAQLPPFCE